MTGTSLNRRRRQISVALISVVLGALPAACGDDKSPTRPTPSNPSVGPTAPGQPALTSLRVNGPSELPPGESAHYTAIASFADGSSRDVTGEAKWSTTNESVLAVTGQGLVTARSAGEAQVRADFGNAGNLAQGRTVLAVPAGRFKFIVTVTEDQVTAPILDARVEVISELGGLSGTTSWDGIVKLYGVPSDFQLRVTKDGYEPLVKTIHLDRQNCCAVRLQMVPTGERIDLRGQYQLTISSGSCTSGGGLPDAVQTRTYTARIWNAGLKVHVQLADADFAVEWCPACNESRGDRFVGQHQVLDGRFTLTEYGPPEEGAGPWDSQGTYPDVAERLPDGRLLSISGHAIVTPTAQGFSGALDGSIAIYDSLPLLYTAGRVIASCRSAAHQFTLVR